MKPRRIGSTIAGIGLWAFAVGATAEPVQVPKSEVEVLFVGKAVKFGRVFDCRVEVVHAGFVFDA